VGFDTRPLTTRIGNRFRGYLRAVLKGFRDLRSNIACIQNWVRGCFSPRSCVFEASVPESGWEER
jgi:hypothetical protein